MRFRNITAWLLLAPLLLFLSYGPANSAISTGTGGAAITGAASTIATADLTASRVLVSNSSGKVAVSTVTSTTLGYLDATSSIQTQLNAKAASSHTHDVSDISGILGSATGGTGNGFTKFTGPTTAEKTFTLPNASATILTTNAAVTPAQGGTGVANGSANTLTFSGNYGLTFTLSGTTALTLPTSGTVLTDGSSIAASQIGSGTIATARLGSGSASSSTYLRGDQTWAAIPASGVIPGNCNLRLTLVSGTAVMTSDQTAKTNIYATPYNGSNCSFYDGVSAWTSLSFSETTLSLSGLTADTNFDVFGYNNSGTMAVEALSWSSSSARATALVLQDGVWVKSGATTRRYLGTFRTTGTTGQTQFSGFTGTPAAGGTEAKLFLFNAQNRVRYTAYVRDSTDSWTHASTWRNANNSATMRVSFVTGLQEQDLNASYSCLAAGGTTTATGVGVNGSSNYSGDSAVEGAYTTTLRGTWRGQTAIGLNYVQALEYSSGTGTFYGDAGGSATQNALIFTGDF